MAAPDFLSADGRPVLLGAEGVLLPARTAYALAKLAEVGARELERANGVRLSDPEAVAGLAALRIAAQRHAEARRRTAASGSSQRQSEAAAPPSDREPITVAEVAERLGCRPRNVRDLVARRRLPAHRLGRALFFDPLDVDAYARRRGA